MKKLIVFLILLSALAQANYVPVTLTVGDGTKRNAPDYASAHLWEADGTFIDSLVFDTSADMVAGVRFLSDSINDAGDLKTQYLITYTFVYGADTGTASEIYVDTTAHQGSASGLTKELIADAVADTLEAGTRNLSLESLAITSSGASDTAVKIKGGLYGLHIENTSNSAGAAVKLEAVNNSKVLNMVASGTGSAISVTGGLPTFGTVLISQTAGKAVTLSGDTSLFLDGRSVIRGDLDISDSLLVGGEQVANVGDSSIYQGSAAGLDTSDILVLAQGNPDAFYGPDTSDVLTLAQGNPDAFYGPDTSDILTLAQGHSDVFYGPSSSGDGITPITLYIMSSTDSSVISKARIVLASLTDSTTLVQNISTASGFRVFTLDINDSFQVFVAYDNYTQTNTDSIFVTGTLTDTIFLTPSSLPASSPGVNYVTAYMDVGTGMIDSTGAMIPVTKLKATLRLVGESNMSVDTLWGLLPRDYIGIIDSTGRVTFRIPANTIINPAGSHYELSFSRGYRPLGYGPFKKFYLDTIPDPVNILNATEVP